MIRILMVSLIILMLTSCDAQVKPNSVLEKYISKKSYSPPSVLKYRIQGRDFIVEFPKSCNSSDRYVALFIRDTISGNYKNIQDEFPVVDFKIRISLGEENAEESAYKIENFFTWDDDLWVMSCCQITRFHYLDKGSGQLIYDRTCDGTTYLFDKKRFLSEGNNMEEKEILEFIIEFLSCN